MNTRDDLLAALTEAVAAREGDSNDDELAAVWGALEVACDLLMVTIPEPDEDEDETEDPT